MAFLSAGSAGGWPGDEGPEARCRRALLGATAAPSPVRWACWTASRCCALPRRCSSTRCAGTLSLPMRGAMTHSRHRPWPARRLAAGFGPAAEACCHHGIPSTRPTRAQTTAHPDALAYAASGTIKTNKVAAGELPARIKILYDGIRGWWRATSRNAPPWDRLRQRQPAVHPAAGPSARRGADGAGVLRLAGLQYTALQMKKAIVGHGHAKKSRSRPWCSDCSTYRGCRARMQPMRWAWPSCAHASVSFAAMGKQTQLTRRQHAQFRVGGPTDQRPAFGSHAQRPWRTRDVTHRQAQANNSCSSSPPAPGAPRSLRPGVCGSMR